MSLLIGTAEGLLVATEPGSPRPAEALAGQTVRVILRSNGSTFAGGDDGVYRSTDGGRSWRRCAAEGQIVWELAASAGADGTLYAGTQPPALYRSRDGGDSWTRVEALNRTPGHERWCVPNSPLGARARAIALDRDNPARYWVGLEVGGVLSTEDDGESWTTTEPGGDPDIHMMVAHPARSGVLFATTGFGRPPDDPQPAAERIAGLFGTEDGGRTWRYLWENVQPRYTRPMCIDRRPPYALTVGCAPSAFSSHTDPGGAKSMLYQSTDAGASFRSLGDAAHSPSAANILCVSPDGERASAVLVGTDTGEVWRVSPEAEWTLLRSDLPAVWSVLAV